MPMKMTPEQAAARAAGKRTYIGTPCIRGHHVRYAISGSCVECRIASDSRYTAQKDPTNFTHRVLVLGDPTRVTTV
ncbi:hypothetical protein HL273_08915 [Yersinia enterocolitica]|uniref:hypothetical protein n=2 Tax=Yersinia enterocolitica TaxID=630 RepID=UPI00155A6AA4|nr:hypothetical protein [Yersinia enterocolitica]MBX9485803.1 hypothetical protein [Yersinia enterocolitica]NQS96736.1 hypothetical protein [Yersinia enterocolitica]NQT43413.1 hypothetical protein [Yersinia enterocolitica]HDL8115261.1 hypothetical protein [Yersinia enterocolitica]HDM8448653.1 hypothetical protein [Yersinia enterocolitica]